MADFVESIECVEKNNRKDRVNVTLDSLVVRWLREKKNYSSFINRVLLDKMRMEDGNDLGALRARRNALAGIQKRDQSEMDALDARIVALENVQRVAADKKLEAEKLSKEKIEAEKESSLRESLTALAACKGIGMVLRASRGTPTNRLSNRDLIGWVDYLRKNNPDVRSIDAKNLRSFIGYNRNKNQEKPFYR